MASQNSITIRFRVQGLQNLDPIDWTVDMEHTVGDTIQWLRHYPNLPVTVGQFQICDGSGVLDNNQEWSQIPNVTEGKLYNVRIGH